MYSAIGACGDLIHWWRAIMSYREMSFFELSVEDPVVHLAVQVGDTAPPYENFTPYGAYIVDTEVGYYRRQPQGVDWDTEEGEQALEWAAANDNLLFIHKAPHGDGA
jgi:hypothetical protein